MYLFGLESHLGTGLHCNFIPIFHIPFEAAKLTDPALLLWPFTDSKECGDVSMQYQQPSSRSASAVASCYFCPRRRPQQEVG
jgi:hypothetical protein